jgi:uncharacterized protein Smg (DUF494 family)
MKEQKLIELWTRVEILGQKMQQIIQELVNLKDLSIGTLETLKRIPGYEEALENMKTDFLNKEKEEKLDVE